LLLSDPQSDPITHDMITRLPFASRAIRPAVPVVASLAALVAVAALSSPIAHAQGIQGNAEAGRDKKSMCVGCHEIPGYKSVFPLVYSVPRIAGQPAQYIENALQAYKRGDRNHPTMRGVAGSLSDQDMADLAAYYSGNGK
jgi:cytochrome c553